MFNKLTVILPTLLRLGLINVVVVALYKITLRLGLIAKWMPIGSSYSQPLFGVDHHEHETLPGSNLAIEKAGRLVDGEVQFFSDRYRKIGSPPDWFLNPFSGYHLSSVDRHWSKLNDFSTDTADIKGIWEASRFDWALILARAYRLTRDRRYLDTLNIWGADWTSRNPANAGPNWKCGQETSIRMLQLLLSAYLLKQHLEPSSGLKRFLTEHCTRISPTIRYAIAQDNNHGTSEAAALFIGGAWLSQICLNDPKLIRKASKWHQKGSYWLENRLMKLVGKDGSFSQYSMNYHRVLVDTLNMVEFWRRELGLKKFSERFYSRSRAAVEWLYQMVDPGSGDAPNMGANDGASLFSLSSADYRDYRPSVQLGAVLFYGKKVYNVGPWDEPLAWLGLDNDDNILAHNKVSHVFPDGGYVTLHSPKSDQDQSWGVVRFSNFRFRPSHADALHFDLWHKGVNLLRDSGSFSYNTEEPWQSYFPGTSAHNTVQFDGRNQMPRLGRFLFGAWLKMDHVGDIETSSGEISWIGSYTDYMGCRHKRTVKVNGKLWRVIDEIDGFSSHATLSWRLLRGGWKVEGSKCIGEFADITVDCNKPITRFELADGWESRYYMQKSKLPVLEVQVEPGKTILTTEILLKD